MDTLYKKHIRLVNRTKTDFVRAYFSSLPWNERMIAIKGSRGVGKTTLLLQYIKKNYGLSHKALYISLDDLYFTEYKLFDVVDDFVKRGGEQVFIDEVHKYPHWAIEIKNIYDYFDELKIVFTGSSLLEILNSRADLSRRALVFDIQGLSFREYLTLFHNIRLDVFSLEEVLLRHQEIAANISKIKPLQYFEDYLKFGYYPFYKDSEDFYFQRLREIVNMIIEIELPLLRKVETGKIRQLKHLLYIIAQSIPFKPNISALAQKTGISRKTLSEYINYLSDSNILYQLYQQSEGVSLLQKPEKIYLENTNIMFAIGNNPDIGSQRETFFLNQVRKDHQLTYPKTADFRVEKKYLFEIGGKSKNKQQIKGEDNAYLVLDNLEIGYENVIPLWLFGFLY